MQLTALKRIGTQTQTTGNVKSREENGRNTILDGEKHRIPWINLPRSLYETLRWRSSQLSWSTIPVASSVPSGYGSKMSEAGHLKYKTRRVMVTLVAWFRSSSPILANKMVRHIADFFPSSAIFTKVHIFRASPKLPPHLSTQTQPIYSTHPHHLLVLQGIHRHGQRHVGGHLIAYAALREVRRLAAELPQQRHLAALQWEVGLGCRRAGGPFKGSLDSKMSGISTEDVGE